MATIIDAVTSPVLFLAIGQIATVTNNSAVPLFLKRGNNAPSDITHPDNIIPAFSTETVMAWDKPVYGVWSSVLPVTGDAVVNDVQSTGANTNKRVSAYRASDLSQSQSRWGMLIDASEDLEPGKAIYIHDIESRVEKGNRVDTEGSVTALFVKSLDDAGADVLLFGGDFWDDGKEQSVNTFSTSDYYLKLDNGELTNIDSTGEVYITRLTSSTMIANKDGTETLVGVGDLLFEMKNTRVDGDTASITVSWEPV